MELEGVRRLLDPILHYRASKASRKRFISKYPNIKLRLLSGAADRICSLIAVISKLVVDYELARGSLQLLLKIPKVGITCLIVSHERYTAFSFFYS
jgi:hypothetical protein